MKIVLFSQALYKTSTNSENTRNPMLGFAYNSRWNSLGQTVNCNISLDVCAIPMCWADLLGLKVSLARIWRLLLVEIAFPPRERSTWSAQTSIYVASGEPRSIAKRHYELRLILMISQARKTRLARIWTRSMGPCQIPRMRSSVWSILGKSPSRKYAAATNIGSSAAREIRTSIRRLPTHRKQSFAYVFEKYDDYCDSVSPC